MLNYWDGAVVGLGMLPARSVTEQIPPFSSFVCAKRTGLGLSGTLEEPICIVIFLLVLLIFRNSFFYFQWNQIWASTGHSVMKQVVFWHPIIPMLRSPP